MRAEKFLVFSFEFLVPKPHRGGLFIGTESLADSSFLFFGGANMEQMHPLQFGQRLGLSHDITLAAPPKNKKKGVVEWSLAINRPPLRGLGTDVRSRTYPSLSKMWVMTSVKRLGYCRAHPSAMRNKSSCHWNSASPHGSMCPDTGT